MIRLREIIHQEESLKKIRMDLVLRNQGKEEELDRRDHKIINQLVINNSCLSRQKDLFQWKLDSNSATPY